MTDQHSQLGTDRTCANTDPPDFRCSICDAVLRPEGWRRRWATCDSRTGCGLLSTHYGTSRRPSRSRWAVMWVAWITGLLIALTDDGPSGDPS